MLLNVLFQVILGGGRQSFTPKTEADPEYPSVMGRRSDGRNLIDVSHSYSFPFNLKIYSVILFINNQKNNLRSFSRVIIFVSFEIWNIERPS